MNSDTPTQKSFRRQLTVTFSVGILALALVTSLTTAWVTSVKVYDQMVEDGLHVTQSLAEQTVLSLLYGSGENAEDAVGAALGFPSISFVSLITAGNETLLTKGIHKKALPQIISSGQKATLARETSDEWIFVAPVFTETQTIADDPSLLLLQNETEPERLGSVLVIKTKDRLAQTVFATIVNNLGIAMIIAAILLFVIHRNFTKISEPLSELSEVMKRAEQGDTNAYATPKGPAEVHHIARTFNKMMSALADRDARLRRHNEHLEHEVSQRTQELVYARDMAIQANKNKSDFLSSVSHELRTPLQSIIGYSDLILETLPDDMEEIRFDQETIVKNANHLLTMINSVLDMSKLESGRMKLQLSQTDINYAVKGVTDTVTPLARSNNNQLHSDIEIEQKVVNIDEAKLRQIILNLLSNAIKFTHDGEIKFIFKQTEKEISFCVEDNGIGMSAEQLEHIFDPFYQVEGGTTRRFEGTGLGLAITHQFCELMGGTINVESTHGKGSTFHVVIPLPIKEMVEIVGS